MRSRNDFRSCRLILSVCVNSRTAGCGSGSPSSTVDDSVGVVDLGLSSSPGILNNSAPPCSDGVVLVDFED